MSFDGVKIYMTDEHDVEFEYEHNMTQRRVSYVKREHDTKTNRYFDLVPISLQVSVYFCDPYPSSISL